MNKKMLGIAIAGAIATPTTVQAVKYKLSGQVNRAVIYSDDGVQSDVINADAASSGTKFRFRGSEDLGNGLKVGMYYELQTSSLSSDSSAAAPDTDSPRNNDGIGIRFANVWFSGNWGKLTVGQGDGAGNGTTESDLSGTANAGTYASKNSFTAGLKWRSSAPGGAQLTNAAGTALTEASTFSNFDAFSRYDALRYDTPRLGPVTLSVSAGNDQLWEVAGRVNTALGGGQISAGAFYGADTGVGNVNGRWGGSLSYLFSQGTSITGHYSKNENQGSTSSDSFSAKLGHKWGPNAVSIGYARTSDFAGKGFDDSGVNIGYVRTLKKANAQVYVAFLHSELDTPTGTPGAEDHNTVLIGANVRFD